LISWPKDESLEASKNLPDPDVIAQEIVEVIEMTLMARSKVIYSNLSTIFNTLAFYV
jgi:hypothetical protein